jgi:hypothetical protein
MGRLIGALTARAAASLVVAVVLAGRCQALLSVFPSSGRVAAFRPHAAIIMMAAPGRERRKENVPGNLYVDESCIDCDTCR